ncbi:membrane protein [Bacteroidia bacterium]|nr:membrane protein [Bacteroidia bacterium]
MVIVVHSCEFFYGGSEGHLGIRSATDGFWVSLIDSLVRSCVPLFVLASAYLLLPIKGSSRDFFKRRFVRVLVPFIVWSLLYAVLPVCWGGFAVADVRSNFVQLCTNMLPSASHLWFVYMLIGLYLFMPVLSPWLKSVSKRGEQAFLLVWAISTFWHYGNALVGDLYGEAFWNEFHTLFYFSGFIGYLVLAHYIRTYIDWSLRKSICIGTAFFIIGYLFTAIPFYHLTVVAGTLYELELSWRFCSPNVAMMTFGIFIMMKHIRLGSGVVYSIVRRISQLSYGMYLMHIFILNLSYYLLHGYFSTPVTIALVAVSTFAATAIAARLLSLLPKSKYIVG